jgi:hypothetical protein
VPVMLSIILTASVMRPDISGEIILAVLCGGTLLAVNGYVARSRDSLAAPANQ